MRIEEGNYIRLLRRTLTVETGHRLLREVDGKNYGELPSGNQDFGSFVRLLFDLDFNRRTTIIVIKIKEIRLELYVKEVFTRDLISLNIGFLIVVRIEDLTKFQINVMDLSNNGQVYLERELGDHIAPNLDGGLRAFARDKTSQDLQRPMDQAQLECFAKAIQSHLHESLFSWGIDIIRVEYFKVNPQMDQVDNKETIGEPPELSVIGEPPVESPLVLYIGYVILGASVALIAILSITVYLFKQLM